MWLQVRDIYKHLSEARASCARPLQVITATATVTSAVDRLGRGLMGRHVRIDANKQKVTQVEEGEADEESAGEQEGSGEEDDEAREAREDRGKAAERAREKADASASFVIPKQLVQNYMVVTCKLRLPALVSFLRTHGKGCKSVVFTSTCDSVDFHHQLFKEAKWIGAWIHPWATAADRFLCAQERPCHGLIRQLPLPQTGDALTDFPALLESVCCRE